MNMFLLFKLICQKIKGPYMVAKKNGMVTGDGVIVMGGVDFGSEPYLITLGNRVRISGQVKFITRDAGTWAFSRESKNKEIVKFGRIIIGDDTFVGTCSIILPGVTIGKNCVIGAGSVVTHDIPDRMVVAGIPARPICSLDEYKNKCKKKMPENFDYKQYVVNKCEYLKTIY